MFNPKSEVNKLPSMCSTGQKNVGVSSQLASQLDNPPRFDGVTISQMRGNPLYSRIDDIDKVGAAQRSIESTGQVLRKAEFVSAFNYRMQHPNINSRSKF